MSVGKIFAGPPKPTFFENIQDAWKHQDRFNKLTLVLGILIVFVVPIAIAQQTGLFIHAGSSVYSTCIAPPPNFTQEQLNLLSQGKKVNWCNTKTLAQNSTQDAQGNSPDTTQTTTTASGNNFLVRFSEYINRFISAIGNIFIKH